MDILVCAKQVPGTSKVDIDEETGVLKRTGADAKMNPYDLYALEAALRLKERRGGTVSVITMGPPQAAEIVREAYATGVDRGILLTDKAFAGSDVLATSRALSGGINKTGPYDLIICGKQTTDGDTAQIGPELAEFLGIPHVTNVTEILETDEDETARDGEWNKKIRVSADMGDYSEICDIEFPCLITVEKEIYTPRLPSYLKARETDEKEIEILALADLSDADPNGYGLDGSPTRVEKIFPPEPKNERITLEGTNGELADKIYVLLAGMKFVYPKQGASLPNG